MFSLLNCLCLFASFLTLGHGPCLGDAQHILRFICKCHLLFIITSWKSTNASRYSNQIAEIQKPYWCSVMRIFYRTLLRGIFVNLYAHACMIINQEGLAFNPKICIDDKNDNWSTRKGEMWSHTSSWSHPRGSRLEWPTFYQIISANPNVQSHVRLSRACSSRFA